MELLVAWLLGVLVASGSETAGISAGWEHSVFVKKDSRVMATGNGYFGQLGVGHKTKQDLPIMVMDDVAAVSAGSSHTLFLKKDGTALATGKNTDGQLGDGTTTNRLSPVAVMTDVAALSAGEFHSLFLKKDGTVWGCGRNNGQLGLGAGGNHKLKYTQPVKVLEDVAAISTAWMHSLFLQKNGTALATGHNNYGQLGDGNTTYRESPVVVMHDVGMVSAGPAYSLFLKKDGTVLAAGYNGNGQLGDGSTTSRHWPVVVMHGVAAVSAGNYHHSLFLKKDGTVLATGSNIYGKQSTSKSKRPIVVLHDVAAVSAGSSHSLFLKKDNSVLAIGYNSYGQLGDGTNKDRHIPVRTKLPQWRIKKGGWVEVMCHSGGEFGKVITAGMRFKSSNDTTAASLEIGIELAQTTKLFSAGADAEEADLTEVAAKYARAWGGPDYSSFKNTTVKCEHSGCLFQYEMRMYEEYAPGTCQWTMPVTQCTSRAVSPHDVGCPPYMIDCKLVGAYSAIMPVSSSLQPSIAASKVAVSFAAVVVLCAGTFALRSRMVRNKRMDYERALPSFIAE